MDFVAKYGNYNFVVAGGLNQTDGCRDVAGRVAEAAKKYGRDTGAFQLIMVIADRTDEMAFAKWEHYKRGTDIEALEWQASQAGADVKANANSTAALLKKGIDNPEPTGMTKIIGSYENVARMLDEIALVPGIKGLMLTFDDFIVGMEQFGEHIQPLMKTRNPALRAASKAA